MKTKILLYEKDIEELIAEKFKVETNRVRVDAKRVTKGYEPGEYEDVSVEAVVEMDYPVKE